MFRNFEGELRKRGMHISIAPMTFDSESKIGAATDETPLSGCSIVNAYPRVLIAANLDENVELRGTITSAFRSFSNCLLCINAKITIPAGVCVAWHLSPSQELTEIESSPTTPSSIRIFDPSKIEMRAVS